MIKISPKLMYEFDLFLSSLDRTIVDSSICAIDRESYSNELDYAEAALRHVLLNNGRQLLYGELSRGYLLLSQFSDFETQWLRKTAEYFNNKM